MPYSNEERLCKQKTNKNLLIVRLVTKTLRDQNIFKLTPRSTAARANVVGELQEIFQIAYNPGCQEEGYCCR